MTQKPRRRRMPVALDTSVFTIIRVSLEMRLSSLTRRISILQLTALCGPRRARILYLNQFRED